MGFKNTISNIFNKISEKTKNIDIGTYISNTGEKIKDTASSIGNHAKEFFQNPLDSVKTDLKWAGDKVVNIGNEAKDFVINKAYPTIKNTAKNIGNKIKNSGIVGKIIDGTKTVLNTTGKVVTNVWKSARNVVDSAIEGVADIFGDDIGAIIKTFLKEIKSQTEANIAGNLEARSYNQDENTSWNNFKTSFISAGHTWIDETPLSTTNGSIYGNMILGTPPTFIDSADPDDRISVNTFVKDARYAIFIPGRPKFNGGFIDQMLTNKKDYRTYSLTNSATTLLEYLTSNGIDRRFADNDLRYYTFESDYKNYYSYLETMLNTFWIKLGLAETNGKFNLLNFFADNGKEELKPIYEKPIGFYINSSSSFTESIDNSENSADIGESTNTNSDAFQRINYLTGMGKFASKRDKLKQAILGGSETLEMYQGVFESMQGESGGGISGLLSAVKDNFIGKDFSALIQQFSVGNGLKVKYPSYWTDSNYSKSISLEFNFTSPYGDPLSIFEYVYVPFSVLACLAMPRQSDENGLISPFFCRVDVPGAISSDLAMISSFQYTKGGTSQLWTKDNIPRSITCSIQVQDLYPYLSLSKRISFLSANPAYVTFLDAMCGIQAKYDSKKDVLENHWENLLSRYDSQLTANKNKMNKTYRERYTTTNKKMGSMLNINSIPWIGNDK